MLYRRQQFVDEYNNNNSNKNAHRAVKRVCLRLVNAFATKKNLTAYDFDSMRIIIFNRYLLQQ